MILTWGSFSLDNNEGTVVITKEPIYSERGYRIGIHESWVISGIAHGGTTQAEVTAAIRARESAFDANDLDLYLYLDDGTTETAHKIESNSTLGGITITAKGFPKGEGAEYSTFRTWTVTVDADVRMNESDLWAFQETLSFDGGGARFVHLQTLLGAPEKQYVAQSVPYRAEQSGTATGFSDYPWNEVPGPIWPYAEQVEKRKYRLVPPATKRGRAHGFTITWSYSFEDANELEGQPTVK